MKVPQYLSPSALGVWEHDQEKYYLQYLADKRPPRYPQTKPMSVGSAFDAYVKSAIADVVWGTGVKEQFEFVKIFEAQVEEDNRDYALEAGKQCFLNYVNTGCYQDLVSYVSKSPQEPRMEFTAGGVDDYGNPLGDIDGVVLLGKPDLEFYVNALKVTFDWKVNGYDSDHGASPVAGYKSLFCVGEDKKEHRDYVPDFSYGYEISLEDYLEEKQPTWATQLSVYGWLTGTPVGDNMVVAVDQLACKGGKIKVTQHRCEISGRYQRESHKRFKDLWAIIHSDHIFRHMSTQDSLDRCVLLDQQSAAFQGGTVKDEWFAQISGRLRK